MGNVRRLVRLASLTLPTLLATCAALTRAAEIGDASIIRYRDLSFDVNNGDQAVHRGPMVHTNLWERCDGAWQIVWSQASGIIRP
jgi:hypothetical protein